MYYLCSEWKENKVMELSNNFPYGLSNSDIKTPWQKTTYGSKVLQEILGKTEHIS